MTRLGSQVYRPLAAHKQVYDHLYAEYLTLHDYFGRGGNDVMKRLKQIKSASGNASS
jgi:L-ribulokinase